MSVREKLRELADTLSEEEILSLLRSVKPRPSASPQETPRELIARIGPWVDTRTTDEIIRDIYDSRTSADPIDL